MDGQQTGNILQHGIEVVDRSQQNGKNAGRPTVDVKNIRHTEELGAIQHRPAKQPKALRVIGIVAGGGFIEKLAIEKLRAIDEIKLHSIRSASIHYGRKTVVVRERDGQTSNRDPPFPQMFLHLPIKGQIDRHLVALPHQLPGQRTDYFCNSARLRVGNAFRRGKNDMHCQHPFSFRPTRFRMMQRRNRRKCESTCEIRPQQCTAS